MRPVHLLADLQHFSVQNHQICVFMFGDLSKNSSEDCGIISSEYHSLVDVASKASQARFGMFDRELGKLWQDRDWLIGDYTDY